MLAAARWVLWFGLREKAAFWKGNVLLPVSTLEPFDWHLWAYGYFRGRVISHWELGLGIGTAMLPSAENITPKCFFQKK